MENDKGLGDRGLFRKGKTGGLCARARGSLADLLREGDSSPPIVVAVSVAVIAVITATPIIVTAVTAAVVPEAIDLADETQLALDLRPV